MSTHTAGERRDRQHVIGSGAHRRVSGGAAYAATKGAMDSFTVALAKESWLQGIRVNAIRQA